MQIRSFYSLGFVSGVALVEVHYQVDQLLASLPQFWGFVVHLVPTLAHSCTYVVTHLRRCNPQAGSCAAMALRKTSASGVKTVGHHSYTRTDALPQTEDQVGKATASLTNDLPTHYLHVASCYLPHVGTNQCAMPMLFVEALGHFCDRQWCKLSPHYPFDSHVHTCANNSTTRMV